MLLLTLRLCHRSSNGNVLVQVIQAAQMMVLQSSPFFPATVIAAGRVPILLCQGTWVCPIRMRPLRCLPFCLFTLSTLLLSPAVVQIHPYLQRVLLPFPSLFLLITIPPPLKQICKSPLLPILVLCKQGMPEKPEEKEEEAFPRRSLPNAPLVRQTKSQWIQI